MPNPDSYAGIGNIPQVTNSGSSWYDCNSITARSSNPLLPNPIYYYNDNYYYIALTNMYRHLHENDSLRASGTRQAFYDGLSTESPGLFLRIEDSLMSGRYSAAGVLISAVSPINAVEENYLDYCTLYKNYAAHGFIHHNATDSSNLWTLAAKCPGKEGACIYQARALYNTVYSQPGNWPSCSSGGVERLGRFSGDLIPSPTSRIHIYPNPATNKLAIVSSLESENLEVEIRDLSGRLLQSRSVKLNNFITNLDLDLINGAYLITITKDNNERVTKKLLIAK